MRPEKSPWCVAAWHRHRDRRLFGEGVPGGCALARPPLAIEGVGAVAVGLPIHILLSGISLYPFRRFLHKTTGTRLCASWSLRWGTTANGFRRPRQGHGVVGARTDTSARVLARQGAELGVSAPAVRTFDGDGVGVLPEPPSALTFGRRPGGRGARHQPGQVGRRGGGEGCWYLKDLEEGRHLLGGRDRHLFFRLSLASAGACL